MSAFAATGKECNNLRYSHNSGAHSSPQLFVGTESPLSQVDEEEKDQVSEIYIEPSQSEENEHPNVSDEFESPSYPLLFSSRVTSKREEERPRRRSYLESAMSMKMEIVKAEGTAKTGGAGRGGSSAPAAPESVPDEVTPAQQ